MGLERSLESRKECNKRQKIIKCQIVSWGHWGLGSRGWRAGILKESLIEAAALGWALRGDQISQREEHSRRGVSSHTWADALGSVVFPSPKGYFRRSRWRERRFVQQGFQMPAKPSGSLPHSLTLQPIGRDQIGSYWKFSFPWRTYRLDNLPVGPFPAGVI